MKNVLILFCVFLMPTCVSGQSTVGLIAHWDMNGSANDVSGHGHNGHANNITPAAGESGVPNTAYYFNGSSSWITVPYDPAFNINKFSICVRVKVMGFYSGLCQGNTVFTRGDGPAHTVGSYCLNFDDNQADSNCYNRDTTLDIFFGGSPLVPYYYYQSFYTPTIRENTWYNVVVTLDDTVFKTYVNGVLKITAPLTDPGGVLGTSTDSISIGADIYGVNRGSYQDYFTGIIDDIMLYNRALSDSEALTYTDTLSCGTITTQPVNVTAIGGTTVKLAVATNITSASYQWQEKSGAVFVDIPNLPPYAGANTDTLTISAISRTLDSTIYRCIVFDTLCSDTSTAAMITLFGNVGVKNMINPNDIAVFPNPVRDLVTISLPSGVGDANIQLLNELGQVVCAQNAEKSCELSLGNVRQGIYVLKISYDGVLVCKKIVKE